MASVAVAGAAIATPAEARRERLALVGTGGRGSTMWGRNLLQDCGDVVEIVGLCDINSKRAAASQKIIGINAPLFVDFDQMVNTTKPDRVVIATVDATHSRYVVRAMELGYDVITEKPLGTDEEQLQSILDAEKRLARKVTVAFNARHVEGAKKIKQFALDKTLGDIISVHYNKYLGTDHGASYFRRWHRLRENSGSLLLSEACHHFDQVNWWLDSVPVEVEAHGALRLYGKNNSFRSTHCRVCPYKDRCQFFWDITRSPVDMKLYAECESEDGYLRDGCVWREDTNIYDTMSVIVRYENKASLTYTMDAFLPFEGEAIILNGTKGRIDWNSYEGGGYQNEEMRLTRTFGKSEVMSGLPNPRTAGHGGADPSLHNLLFRHAQAPDPLGLHGGTRAGVYASLIGIGAYRSIDRGGQVVKLRDLVEL
jgi:predicted dehydrogenase